MLLIEKYNLNKAVIMVLHEIYSYDEVADAMFVSIPVDYNFAGVIKWMMEYFWNMMLTSYLSQ